MALTALSHDTIDRFRMATSSSTRLCEPCMSLTFQDGYIEFHEFLQTLSVTYVSGWLHRVLRVLANPVCDVRFRMVTSSSTSLCKPCGSLTSQNGYIEFHEFLKPCLSFTFQDGYTEFHEFLQTLSVIYVSGWLHRVPRVLQDMCVTCVSGWLHRVPRILQAFFVTYV